MLQTLAGQPGSTRLAPISCSAGNRLDLRQRAAQANQPRCRRPRTQPNTPATSGFSTAVGRPTRLGTIWGRAFAWLSGHGLLSKVLVTLQVKDRRSGLLHATVLVVATYRGQRYLVSMLGNDAPWVQNVRAAGGKASIKRCRSDAVVLTEIPSRERPPILKAWCDVATSGRRHLPVSPRAPISAFEAIADEYPVFRIDPAS